MEYKLRANGLKRKKELLREGLELSGFGKDKKGDFCTYYDECNRTTVKLYHSDCLGSIYGNILSVSNYIFSDYGFKSELRKDIATINNYIETLKTKKCA